MTEKSHWPFDSESEKRGPRDSDRSPQLKGKQAYVANKAASRQMMRHDRLIVGGRAHTKKSGLS
jgi:hypothetical protein